MQKTVQKTQWIITALALSAGTTGVAKEFYVAKQGGDNAAGTRQAPFSTIQNAASVMQPGDICYISAGTYTETVIPKNSGTADYPIIFKLASVGDHVVLTGAEIISHDRWGSVGKNRFKCTIKLPLPEGNQLFSGEKSMVEARWPNVGDDLLKPTLAVMGKGTTPEHILCPELPDYDFTGGRVWVHAPMYSEHDAPAALNP